MRIWLAALRMSKIIPKISDQMKTLTHQPCHDPFGEVWPTERRPSQAWPAAELIPAMARPGWTPFPDPFPAAATFHSAAGSHSPAIPGSPKAVGGNRVKY